jgi:hypothetical protein
MTTVGAESCHIQHTAPLQCSANAPSDVGLDFSCGFLRQQVYEFAQIYEQSPDKKNSGGIGFWHAFYLYVVIRNLRPTTIIQAGEHNGIGTWYLRQAAGPETRIIVLSKHTPSVYRDRGNAEYLAGKGFVDFAKVDWSTRKLDMDRTLVFFDDHRPALMRSRQAQDFGFVHVVIDDNYPPGFGDHYSLKQACDGGRWFYVNCVDKHSKTKCEHKSIKYLDSEASDQPTLTNDEIQKYALEFSRLVDVYYEFPPLWTVHGRSRFKISNEAMDAGVRPPVFAPDEETELQRVLSVSMEDEAARFSFATYVRLRSSH